MTARQILLDLGRCGRASGPPLLTLDVLTLAGTTYAEGASGAASDGLFLLGWRAAVSAALLWFLGAVTWSATRPWRDRRAFQRLQRLREIATPPNRVLVHVQTTLWNASAGQHVVVVNVATGSAHRLCLPEANAPVGSFVLLEQRGSGVGVVDLVGARLLEAAHRQETRRARSNVAIPQRAVFHGRQESEAASELVRETEEYLRTQ